MLNPIIMALYDAASSWLGKVRPQGGQEVAIFWQTPANFQQMRLWVLKILILTPNCL